MKYGKNLSTSFAKLLKPLFICKLARLFTFIYNNVNHDCPNLFLAAWLTVVARRRKLYFG
jgi:hypothetical protein